MSLARLPCILVATVGLHKTWTAPDASTKAEQAPVTNIWDWFLHKVRDFTMPVKSVFWTIGFAEAAVILANKYPAEPLSRHILSTLMRSGRAEYLRLNRLAVAGVSLIGLGTLLRMYCYRAMKGFFTFDISIRENHQLVTTGPYSVVRHPGYTGLSIVYIGLLCWHGAEGSWLRESGVLDTTSGIVMCGALSAAMVSVLVGLLRRMSAEDAALQKAFGPDWVEWSQRVPYTLIPGVY
ncbi:hypothetical protein BDZ94DRAFT_1246732 [Collybia nuda]|uniref:Protein-S-isoprenylcysteine O-methyltransferase n=1 Tax=Collybia nuda TaxID=64659 RepID=A0A9P5YIE2_9AGAR|nr:hypothetical protein BDZ94DRAFT_1246732 [Collybia nuda]